MKRRTICAPQALRARGSALTWKLLAMRICRAVLEGAGDRGAVGRGGHVVEFARDDECGDVRILRVRGHDVRGRMSRAGPPAIRRIDR